MISPLSNDAIQAALADLPGWSHADDKINKTFKFASFREAMSFIVRIGFEAEAADHHPELFNVYSTVAISLNTHDAQGKVTQKDIDLAQAIDRIDWT